MPDLKIRGVLNHAKCVELYESRRCKWKLEKSVGPSGAYHIIPARYASRPDDGPVDNAFSLRMYRTEIITCFADGAVKITDWNSNTTTRVLNAHSPVWVGGYSQCKFREKRRWRAEGDWRDPDYPLDSTLFIGPDSYVHGCVDKRRRVNPELRAERSRIMREFRRKNIGRFALGEFKELCAEYTSVRWNGEKAWIAKAPAQYMHRGDRVFEMLMAEDHAAAVEAWHAAGTYTLHKRFGREKCTYPSFEHAALASMNAILRNAMEDEKWYDDEIIEYPPIRVL